MASNLLQAALYYADLGYPVLPCAPNEKRPLTEHGLLDATTDLEQVEAWWKRWPSANVAIRTDGLIAVDIDDPESSWPNNPDNLSDLDAAPTSITPRGGRHIIYRQPEGRGWRNTEKTLASGVDTRADGGYILVAPSIVNGKHYQWLNELDVSPAKLPEPPAWLTERLDTIAQAPMTTTVGDGNPIPDGQRNATLARLAGSMRRVGMTQAEIHAALHQINVDRCNPPLPEREVDRVAANIARYEPDQFATAAIEDHYTQDRQAAIEPAADPGPIPEHLFHVPGFIEQVMEFTLANAPYPNVGLAFCGALALQSYLCGRKVCTPGDLRSNLYLLALASSGTGKDFPRKVNARVLLEIGQVGALGDKFASGEGIQDALIRSSAMLFQNDEMDGLLRQINLDRENRRESIPNILLTLYTSANDV